MNMADSRLTCKLKYLEANYEKCKLKVRENSLYCRIAILEYHTRIEEEKRITVEYENKAIAQQLKQAQNASLYLQKKQSLLAKQSKEHSSKLEAEYRDKENMLLKRISSLQEDKDNVINERDTCILTLTKEIEHLKRLQQSKDVPGEKNKIKTSKRAIKNERRLTRLKSKECHNVVSGALQISNELDKESHVDVHDGGRCCHFVMEDNVYDGIVDERGEQDLVEQNVVDKRNLRKGDVGDDENCVEENDVIQGIEIGNENLDNEVADACDKTVESHFDKESESLIMKKEVNHGRNEGETMDKDTENNVLTDHKNEIDVGEPREKLLVTENDVESDVNEVISEKNFDGEKEIEIDFSFVGKENEKKRGKEKSPHQLN